MCHHGARMRYSNGLTSCHPEHSFEGIRAVCGSTEPTAAIKRKQAPVKRTVCFRISSHEVVPADFAISAWEVDMGAGGRMSLAANKHPNECCRRKARQLRATGLRADLVGCLAADSQRLVWLSGIRPCFPQVTLLSNCYRQGMGERAVPEVAIRNATVLEPRGFVNLPIDSQFGWSALSAMTKAHKQIPTQARQPASDPKTAMQTRRVCASEAVISTNSMPASEGGST
jgi:hypothetical protein